LAPAARQQMPHERNIRNYQIVGVFERPAGVPGLITPLPHLQEHVGESLRYDRAEFELNPAFNRELDVFREKVNELAENNDPPFVFVLRDHILREVVEPLEQNIAMMEALYPIILGLSGVIAIGLTILLLLPMMKDAAIMRATGMTKLQVTFVLGVEQKILCVMGLVLGLIVSFIAFGWVNLLGAALYLGGCVLAGIILSIVLANKKPLELLQVKE